MGTMTVRELIERLSQCDPDAEVMIRVEAHDFTVLDFLEEWRGHPYIFALEAGK